MAQHLPSNIIYGGPVIKNEAKNSDSIGEYILNRLKSYGDNVVLIDGATGEQYTSKFLHGKATRLAHALSDLGIKRGDVISISSENRVDFVTTLLATFAIGATFAPLNVTYTDSEIEHAIQLSKPKIIFASNLTCDQIERISKRQYFIKFVVCFDKPQNNSVARAFEDLLKSSPQYVDFMPPKANKTEDIAVIVCSSGTTGLPKGVQLTQHNILATIDLQSGQDIDSPNEFAFLSVIPWFHAFGCLSLITTMSLGARLVYLARFEENIFLSCIEKYRIMLAFMVPPLMVFLAKHPIVDKYDLSSLVFLVCGAAPLSRETEEQIKQRIGVPFIRQGYGLSETTLSVAAQEDNCKPGSVGKLKAGMYAKVINPDTGEILSLNQRGELCFKGDTIMKGYIGDVSSTQSAIRDDGWLHTGDIGYFDDDLELFIVDRIKELIKYKAFQVPPAEIEAILLTHPKIRDAAVIGKPDEVAGELPMAFVVKQPNAVLSDKDVVKYVAERTSTAKRLRGGVCFIDEIPKNPSGKILRRLLRDKLSIVKSKL